MKQKITQRTTDLASLRRDPEFWGEVFTWGEITSIQEIGPYVIVACHPWKKDGCSFKVGVADRSVTEYHSYVDGRSTSTNHGTLDAALAHAMAYKYDGMGSRAGEYFLRMIGRAQ